MSNMEECIKREIGGREPDQVERLILDQAKCSDGLAHLAPFENLVSLSMNDASISSLSTMPALNNLATLKLSDNKIKNGLESLTKLSALEKLYLGGNQIPDIESLEPLKKLAKLEWLDLEGNPVTRVPDYTEKVFEMLENLMVLDGCNRDGEELPDADDDDEVLPSPRFRSRNPPPAAEPVREAKATPIDAH
jgi:U2 small nuclear ribonucleoprotein A'